MFGVYQRAGVRQHRTSARAFVLMGFNIRAFGRTVYDRLTDLDTLMTEYMTAGETHSDPDPWDESPFAQIYRLVGHSANKNAVARENAERIRGKVLRDGEISTDEAVEKAMKPVAGPETRATAYYLGAGPVAATADDLRWTTAFRLDAEDAPEYGTDAYFDAASELSIPDTKHNKLVPKKVEKCYRGLEEATERNDAVRFMHPEELRTIGPRLRDRVAERAFEYLAELPGVIPPEESGPAWVHVDSDEAAVAGETAEVEG